MKHKTIRSDEDVYYDTKYYMKDEKGGVIPRPEYRTADVDASGKETGYYTPTFGKSGQLELSTKPGTTKVAEELKEKPGSQSKSLPTAPGKVKSGGVSSIPPTQKPKGKDVSKTQTKKGKGSNVDIVTRGVDKAGWTVSSTGGMIEDSTGRHVAGGGKQPSYKVSTTGEGAHTPATDKPKVKKDTKPKDTKPKDTKLPPTAQTPPKKENPYTKAKAKDANLDQYIKARNAAEKGSTEYAEAQNKINEAYGVSKRHKADTPKLEARGPKPMITPNNNRIEETVRLAKDPSHDIIASKKAGTGRLGRVYRRTQNRLDKLAGKLEKRTGVSPQESPKQERKDLLTYNPVPDHNTSMEKAAKAVDEGDKKALRKSGVSGKHVRAGMSDIRRRTKAGSYAKEEQQKNQEVLTKLEEKEDMENLKG